MRFLVFLMVFWASAPAFSNDFVVCGWRIESDDQRRQILELSGAARAPFAVHFSYYSLGPNGSGRLNHCGGALLAPGWVLTARHCVDQKRWAYLSVDLPGAGQSAEANMAICPTETLPFPKNDVALLQLVDAVPEGGVFAQIGPKIDGFPMSGYIARWPIFRGRPATDMMYSGIDISHQTPTPMLAGGMIDRSERVPCGGESGSMLIDKSGALAGVLTAISSPGGRRPDCNNPDTRIFVTPLAGWAGWIEKSIAACDADPSVCAIGE